MLALCEMLSVKLHFNDTPRNLSEWRMWLMSYSHQNYPQPCPKCRFTAVFPGSSVQPSTGALPSAAAREHMGLADFLCKLPLGKNQLPHQPLPACSKGPIHIANGLSLNHHLQYISGLSQWPVLSHTSESYHPLSLGLQRPHSKILFEQDRSSGEVSGFAVDMLPAEAGGSHIWSQTGIHGWKPALVT